MNTPSAIIIALWVVFYSFWLVSATRVKRVARKAPFWQGAGVRALLVITAVVLTESRLIRKHFVFQPFSPAPVLLGVVMCAAGLMFAVWARLHLGRNWGTPMSLREDHELVTTGPYRFIRHPIYTGMLFALLGSGLAAGPLWFLISVMVCPFLVYSARKEEQMMMLQFPDAYPEYKSRTKTMVPFVW